MTTAPKPARIESLHVSNYRALKDITLAHVTPLTVLLGPNGSGKSTVFDVFAFLSECFTDGLRRAWDRRGRFRELRSRDSEGPIIIEIKYREQPDTCLITYRLEIEEQSKGPVIKREFLRWKRGHPAAPFHFLDYQYGQGQVITGEKPEPSDTRVASHCRGQTCWLSIRWGHLRKTHASSPCAISSLAGICLTCRRTRRAGTRKPVPRNDCRPRGITCRT